MIDEATQEKFKQWAKEDPLGLANWLEKELDAEIARMEAKGIDTSKSQKTQQAVEKMRSAIDTLKKVGIIEKIGQNLGKIIGIDSV